MSRNESLTRTPGSSHIIDYSVREFTGNYLSFLLKWYCVKVSCKNNMLVIFDLTGQLAPSLTHTYTHTHTFCFYVSFTGERRRPMLGIVRLCRALVKDLHNDQLNLVTPVWEPGPSGCYECVCGCVCVCVWGQGGLTTSSEDKVKAPVDHQRKRKRNVIWLSY